MLSFKELNQQYLAANQRAWAADTAEKIRHKVAETSHRAAGKVPYSTVNGIFDDLTPNIDSWCSGFWSALLWLMYTETHETRYAELAREIELKQDRCFREFIGMSHDAGFRWLPTAVADYRLTGHPDSRQRGLHAATILAGRYNPACQIIRAWDGQPEPGQPDNRGWGIIDCMMNLPILYWASSETQDPRFRQIAMRHADRVMETFVRGDGSCEHIVEFNPDTGEKVGTYGGQGYADGSSWTRGQAWGLYGFTLSYIHTGKTAYLDTAKRIAHYFMANIPESGLIPVDFRQPPEPAWEDSTAAAIAACGLLELAKRVNAGERQLYLNGALRLLQALSEKRCVFDLSNEAIVQKCSARYHEETHEYNIIYGDSYFAEAIFKLNGNDFLIW